jgi:regulator of sirC expression with transglutaminase-like and TPR domain
MLVRPEDCARLLRQVFGRPVTVEPHFLAGVTRRQILTRLLTNLKHLYARQPDPARLLATIEHLLIVNPSSLDELRDRGLVRAQLGQRPGAITDLETYLRFSGEAVDATAIARKLDALRRSEG